MGTEYPLIEDAQQLNKSITAIDLRGKRLRSIPNEVLSSNQLRILLLDKNELTKIAARIGQLKKLKTLSLSENGHFEFLHPIFIDDPLSVIPAEIGQLRELQTLDLNSNQFSSLPAEIGQLKQLQTLNLGNNQLSSLPVEITQLKGLKKLDLSGNQLSSLPPEIEQLKNLKELYLWDNNLSDQEKEKIKKLLPNCVIKF